MLLLEPIKFFDGRGRISDQKNFLRIFITTYFSEMIYYSSWTIMNVDTPTKIWVTPFKRGYYFLKNGIEVITSRTWPSICNQRDNWILKGLKQNGAHLVMYFVLLTVGLVKFFIYIRFRSKFEVTQAISF